MDQRIASPAIENGISANGQPIDLEQRARELAARYRCEFVDLRDYHLDAELFKTVPVDLMFRYSFVPLEENEGVLWIALADPSKLMMIDEIGLLLNRRVKTKVATLAQINEILKKTEQSQRVLEEASEGFVLDVVRDDEGGGDENITIDRITGTQDADVSPIIRLVDTTIFTALQKRASDIHIETESDSVVIKYRIDGVLQQALNLAKEHHSTIITRVKVMSELDIAERRVPQDGRFRVKYIGRLIDFRVSIMPTIHGENAVLRVANDRRACRELGMRVPQRRQRAQLCLDRIARDGERRALANRRRADARLRLPVGDLRREHVLPRLLVAARADHADLVAVEDGRRTA